MRLGILGGSFDPIHYAHLLMAECCRESHELDEVWFVPAFLAPHKQDRPAINPQHRIEMLNLAIGGHDAFRLSTLELDRGGVSYTAETLRQIVASQPEAKLFFIMGADSLSELPNWREPDQICQLATPIVVARPDWPEPDFAPLDEIVGKQRRTEIEGYLTTMPLMQLSSGSIRERVRAGASIRYRVPRAVEKYIEAQRLYQS